MAAVELREKPLHEVPVFKRESLAVSQKDGRIVHELVRETVGEHLENLFGIVAVMQVTQGPLKFEVAQIVGAVAKRLDGRHRFTDLEPG